MEIKEHKTYQEQIQILIDRGLSFQSYDQLLNALKTIGYYRLSAYTYPFRIPLETPIEQVDSQDTVLRRADNFVPGASFENAMKLYKFDIALRNVLQKALDAIEVAFCAQVAYVLGRRDPEAHLQPIHLNTESCDEIDARDENARTRHEVWLSRHTKLKDEAAQKEDYIKHHILNYDGKIPVWVATEFMDFGNVLRLFGLMKKEDQVQIAEFFGLAGDQSGTLSQWMLALNVLRNHCAHNNRVWNRISRNPRKPATKMVSDELHHIRDLNESDMKKLYPIAAVIAYLVVRADKESNWPLTARTEFKKFGDVGGMTLENTMGFPSGWETFQLWNAGKNN